ncbi:MAG: protein kinase [Candidatus Melainabacteria bacterium]|nr:protein kinase [Candidatus Melainabacteria bacterium]
MPRNIQSSGLITGWLAVCSCDLQIDDIKTISICRSCGKRIDPGRQGSLTQLIFRSDICSCLRIGEDSQSSTLKGPAFEGFVDTGEEEEMLPLECDEFPVDRYKPVRELGRGSTGVVYLCRDRLLLGKRVAVKVLSVLTAEQLVSFQEEARTTSRLDHRGIGGILDFGSTTGGVPYMVLDYFPGMNLENYLLEYGPLDENTVRVIFLQVMEALEYAHRLGIFHRDLKPSNILVSFSEEGEIVAKLIDFGIARVSELTGATTRFQGRTLAGTPFYMSPDVAGGYDYSPASEVYSLGCVMFEILTGSVPFRGETALDTLLLHANAPLPPVDEVEEIKVSEQVKEFLMRCLEKNPDYRFGTMTAAREFLLADSKEEETRADEPVSRSSPPSLKFWGIALAVLGLAGLAGWQMVNSAIGPSPVIDYKPPDNTGTSSLDAKLTPEVRFVGKDSISLSGLYGQLDLKILSRYPQTRQLKVRFADMTSNPSSLAELPLSILRLDNCRLSEKTFKTLSRIRTLEDLSLIESAPVTGSSIAFLQTLPKLSSLQLNRIEIEQAQRWTEIFESMSKIRSIQQIYINSCGSITGENLRALRALPDLRYLTLAYCVIDNDCLPEISQCGGLESLSLRRCQSFDGSNLECLQSLKKLSRLDLGGTSIAPEHLDKVLLCSNLSRLDLADLNLSDRDIARIDQIRLEYLNLSNTQVSQPALSRLKRVKSIEMRSPSSGVSPMR